MTPLSRRAPRLVALLLALALVAACARLIPPQSVDDPFRLDGQVVPVTFGAASPALAPLAVNGSAATTFAFDDLGRGLPVRPRVIRNRIGIAGAVLVSGSGPATITLRDLTLTLRGWQGAGAYDAAPVEQRATARLDASVTVELRQEACTDLACTYAVVGDATLGDLALEGEALTRFLDLATSAPTTNAAEASFTVTAEQDELAGATLGLRLEASQGLIEF